MRIRPCLRAGLLLVCVLLPAGMDAQEDVEIGGMQVHLQKDSAGASDLSFAVLRASADTLQGAIVLACGGDPAGLTVGLMLSDSSIAVDSALQTVWRFDQDPPRTVALWRRRQAWPLLPLPTDVNALAARARRGGTLVLQVPADPPSCAAAEYRYSLAGVDPALGRMGCAGSAGDGSPPAGLRTLSSLIMVFQEVGAPAEIAVVEEMQLLNASDVRRWVEREYPPLLRDAGITGSVELRVRVMESGVVDSTSVQVIRSTHGGFVDPASRIARRMRFRPTRVNGKPVKAWVDVPFAFRVSVPVAPPPPD